MDREELRATLKMLGYVTMVARNATKPAFFLSDAHYKLYTTPTLQAAVKIILPAAASSMHCHFEIAPTTTGYRTKRYVFTFEEAHRVVLQWEENAG
jgi:gentisate 1,2-dioxygenase